MLFNVGPYKCYIEKISKNNGLATVVLVNTFPLLQAERAVSTVAKLLNCPNVELCRVDGPKGVTYHCRIKDVEIKEIKEWLQ